LRQTSQILGRAISPAVKKFVKPVSLRVKLLVGFSVVFSLVFAGAFYWFYSYTTEKVVARLRADMRSTLIGAMSGVNPDELMELYAEGQPNAEGFSDDPRYRNQIAWFETVQNIEPRVWLYSYIIGNADTNRRVGLPAVSPGEKEIIYLVDLWALNNPAKAAKFLESDHAGLIARRIELQGGIQESDIYTDRWGTWISAAAPLKSQRDDVIAVIGLDIDAQYVRLLQQAIRSRMLFAFIVTYAVFFLLIYMLSGILTRQLASLTQSAQQIASGDYSLDLYFAEKNIFPDEMTTLAEVFKSMVDSIRIREQMIREGKRTEDEMRLALKEERELSELKSRFVSMVSHELRTPLTVLRTSLELLERYGHVAPEEKREKYFQRSRAAIATMNQLIEDVLVSAKAEAGRLEFSPSWIDLKSFCRDVVEEMRMSIGTSHKIVLNCYGSCELVYLDPKLLRSILSNLISNAVKYSLADGVVEFDLSCFNQVATFEIRDYGIGIPDEDQPRLFRLFHRASNVNAIRGTGLGLAIVYQCVLQHQGEIYFTSCEGVGTSFVVKLPLTLGSRTERLSPESV
jgi:signal transduction histidine kinase